MEDTLLGENRIVVSDKVQTMARGIYQEFERMIKKYDEEVVKNLMPMVVALLENIESSHLQAEEAKIELELLKEDNDQLMTQYEKEKLTKKTFEQKYFELDDVFEGEKHNLKERIKSLESIVHIMELKAKNATDHANRLEEKENELKKDYTKLHDRYTELFKTHMDYKERNKIVSKLNSMGAFSPDGLTTDSFAPLSIPKNTNSVVSSTTLSSKGGLLNQFDLNQHDNNFMDDNFAESIGQNQNIRDSGISGKSETDKQQFSGDEDGSASDHIFAMGKEVENLIEENNELLATKNALNIVKDDLIIKVDELTSEQEMLREEIESLQRIKENLMARIEGLERDLKDARTQLQNKIDEAERAKSKFNVLDLEGDEENIPPSMRKRFTRLEMARVILERNEYKEKWLELQDAVRWTETIKAARNEKFAAEGGRMISANASANNSFFAARDAALLKKQLHRQRTRDRRLLEERGIVKKGGTHSPSTPGVSTIWNFFSQLFRGAGGSDSGLSPDDIHSTALDRAIFNGGGNNDSTRTHHDVPVIQYSKANQKIIPGVKSFNSSGRLDLVGGVMGGINDRDLWLEKYRRERAAQAKHRTTRFASQAPPLIRKSSFSDQESSHQNQHRLQYDEDGENFFNNTSLNSSTRFQAYGWSLPISQSQFIFPSSPYNYVSSKTAYPYYLGDPGLDLSNASECALKMSLPVPIYCRPLTSNRNRFPGCKIICASGVNLSGGRTRDGGKICGASVFYNTNLSHKHITDVKTPIDNTHKNDVIAGSHNGDSSSYTENKESLSRIVELERELLANMSASRDLSTSYIPNDFMHTDHDLTAELISVSASPSFANYSTLVWLCCSSSTAPTSNPVHSTSHHDLNYFDTGPQPLVIIIDATDPSNILDSFTLTLPTLSNPDLSTTRYAFECDVSVENDLNPIADLDPKRDDPKYKTLVGCRNILCLTTVPGIHESEYFNNSSPKSTHEGLESSDSPPKNDAVVEMYPCATTQDTNMEVSEQPDHSLIQVEASKMSTLMPTMWIGLQNGIISIHSSICNWDKPLSMVRLKDSILTLVHFKGHVYAGLANGTIVVFQRNPDGSWDIQNPFEITLGSKLNFNGESECLPYPIRCVIPVCDKYIWASSGNTIYCYNPKELKIVREFSVDSRQENHIAHMVWCGGPAVWVSYRMNLVITLLNTFTFECIARIDLQPFLTEIAETEIYPCQNHATEDASSTITNALSTYSHLDRITALSTSCHRLWIGTAKGSILSIPFSKPPPAIANAISNPMDFNHDSSDSESYHNKYHLAINPYDTSSLIVTQSFIPFCKVSDAQFSFHAHKDAVKFLLTVPSGVEKIVDEYPSMTQLPFTSRHSKGLARRAIKETLEKRHYLIMSGGEGYVDYRNDNSDDSNENCYENETDHLAAEALISTDQKNWDPLQHNSQQPFPKSTDDIINKGQYANTANLESFIQKNLTKSYGLDDSNSNPSAIRRLRDKNAIKSRLLRLRRKNIPHLIVWRTDV